MVTLRVTQTQNVHSILCVLVAANRFMMGNARGTDT